MEAVDSLGVMRHESQQDEHSMPPGSASDVTREAVLSHTGEVFEALQQKVQELNAQLDGSRVASGNGFESPLHLDALSRHEEDAGSTAAPTTPDGQSAPRLAAGMYSPEVEQCVRQSVAELEAKLEGVLEGVADDLAAEVSREQQHLLLMQSQVDKQGQTLLREISALQGRLDQERTQRTFVQSAVKDSKDEVSIKLQQQAQELAALRKRLATLETPWLVRVLGSLSQMVWGPCGSTSPAAAPGGHGGGSSAAASGNYQVMPGSPSVSNEQQRTPGPPHPSPPQQAHMVS